MHWLVEWSVRRRVVVAVLAAIFLVVGAATARKTPVDVFPEFVPAQVSIQTEAPGFTPGQVETLITQPIEVAVNGAPGLAAMRSDSIQGLSAITIDFHGGVDAQRAHQDVAERLARVAGTLPTGSGAPKLSPLVSSTMDVLKIGLVSDRLDAFELRTLADWNLRPQLLAVPGVARVNVFGGKVRQLQIAPDLAKLEAYGLGVGDVAEAARAALTLRGAGFLDLASQRVLIESPIPAPDPGPLAAAVVTVRNGVALTIGDVARVEVGSALRAGDTLVHLVGTPHPGPHKAAEFERVDLASIRATCHAARASAARHLVYVSVAHPAPVMRAYIAVRCQGEDLIAATGIPATILRPWYVLGPGHRWPYLLTPVYAILRQIPGTRDTAIRLGLVTRGAMVAALANAVVDPPAHGRRIVTVPDIAAAPSRTLPIASRGLVES